MGRPSGEYSESSNAAGVVSDWPGTRYHSAAQAPKSVRWHRSEQNGRHGFDFHAVLPPQTGQRTLLTLLVFILTQSDTRHATGDSPPPSRNSPGGAVHSRMSTRVAPSRVCFAQPGCISMTRMAHCRAYRVDWPFPAPNAASREAIPVLKPVARKFPVHKICGIAVDRLVRLPTVCHETRPF
jgi:hypothetical protein